MRVKLLIWMTEEPLQEVIKIGGDVLTFTNKSGGSETGPINHGSKVQLILYQKKKYS